MATAPANEPLPRYVAPLPRWLEDAALRNAWLIVSINLVGAAFGFWFYAFETGQLLDTPIVMWPWVPDSPLATLFMAISLVLWKLDRLNEVVNALAFIGNLKLGLWTPYTLLVFHEQYAALHPGMYQFLFWSHLGMVAQAFLIQRYSRFPVWAIAAALAWYTFDLVVDYFVPIVGGPHHTTLPFADPMAVELWGDATAFQVAAAGAVVPTIWIAFVALATRAKKARIASSNV